MLKVRMRLALTPGGGSNVKIREPLRRLTGTCVINEVVEFIFNCCHFYSFIILLHILVSSYLCKCILLQNTHIQTDRRTDGRMDKQTHLGVDFHGKEESEVGMRCERMKFLL